MQIVEHFVRFSQYGSILWLVTNKTDDVADGTDGDRGDNLLNLDYTLDRGVLIDMVYFK